MIHSHHHNVHISQINIIAGGSKVGPYFIPMKVMLTAVCDLVVHYYVIPATR